MRLRGLYFVVSLLAGSAVALAGCASKPPAKPQQSAAAAKALAVDSTPSAAAPTTRPAPSHDLLEAQVAAYAAKLEQVLAKQKADAQAGITAASTQPTTEPVADGAATDQFSEADVPAATDPVRAAKPKRGDVATDDANVAPQPPRATVTSDELLRRLATRAKDYPRDLSVHLDYQLLQLLRDEKVPGMPDIASLPAEDHELLAALLDALSNFRSAVQRDNNMLQAQKVRPLLELGNRLRAQSELTIPTLALCKKVTTFGLYDPIEPEFAAGRVQKAILYCEVENFASQLNEQQMWETRLSQDVVLYTENGLPIWQPKQHAVTDVSRNRRHDFFVVERIELPATLTIGRYLLKVSVIDQHAHRIAESTLPVKVVARANNNIDNGNGNGANFIDGPRGTAPGTAPATAPQSPADAAASLIDAFNK